MKIKDLKLGTKLVCGLLSVILLFLISSAYQMYSIRQLRLIQLECAERAGNALAIKEIGLTVERSYNMLDDAVIKGAPGESKKELAGLRQSAMKDMETISAIAAIEQEKQWAADFAAHYKKYLDMCEKQLAAIFAVQENAPRQPVGEDMKKAEQKINELKALLAQERAACRMPLDRIKDLLVKKNAEGNSTYHKLAMLSLNSCGATVLLALLLSQLIAYFIIRAIRIPVLKAVRMAEDVSMGDLDTSIDVQQKDEIGVLADTMKRMVHNLKGLVRLAEKIALGDLTVRVKPLSDKDVLGHALKTMVKKLSETIAEINISADNVAAGAAQMNSANQAMSQGATEQASSLEEISSSMNEIAAQTRQNAENASQANRLAVETKMLAERGNEQMARMVSAMKEINESSSNISKIIKVIDEIAFQTNLLALNAAVEAARAGRYGKGFAVVAEEVRNLAARSAKAAKETADMVEGSVRKVEGGTDMADKTAGALKEIVAAASKVTDLVAEIAAASNEQAQGVSQITAGLGQIDHVTQQNTAHAEESASAAEELSSQAMVLQQLVSTFKVDERMAISGPEAGKSRSAGQRMLASENAGSSNGSRAYAAATWGGAPAGNQAPEPVIALDDREFGKY